MGTSYLWAEQEQKQQLYASGQEGGFGSIRLTRHENAIAETDKPDGHNNNTWTKHSQWNANGDANDLTGGSPLTHLHIHSERKKMK